jgi:hypothetical protein
MVLLRRKDISPTMKAASKLVSKGVFCRLKGERCLTYSQVGPVKSTQADLLLQRDVPEGEFIHTRSCCDEDDDGVNEKDERNFGRIWMENKSKPSKQFERLKRNVDELENWRIRWESFNPFERLS